jgi:DedD protein
MIGSGIAPVQVEVLELGPAKMVYVTAPAPLPARAAPRPVVAEAAPRAVAAVAAPRPAAVEAAPRGAAAQYRVHAGVYADYDRARREQRRLDGVAGRVHLAQVDAAEARYYQLRVGPFASRDDAARAARRLAELGAPALVVTAGATR